MKRWALQNSAFLEAVCESCNKFLPLYSPFFIASMRTFKPLNSNNFLGGKGQYFLQFTLFL